MSPKKFVAYYRVSTKAQGVSGLGLEAQREVVRGYVLGVGGQLIESFEEVESGKRVDRSNLLLALDLCRREGAMLVIAKLDRLARNVSFISKLLDSGVEFIAADMPTANRLTIHIVAAIAEYEREQISQRVKGALKAALARGATMGNPNLGQVRPRAVEAAKERADAFARRMAPVLLEIEADRPLALMKLALILERRGFKTAMGKENWSATAVHNLKKRIERLEPDHV